MVALATHCIRYHEEVVVSQTPMGLPLAQVDVKAAVRFGQIKTIAAKVVYRGSVSGSVMVLLPLSVN